VRCSHPESALVGIEPEHVWCSRCGSLAQYNAMYEPTWRPPSLDVYVELAVSEEVRLAQAAHLLRLTSGNLGLLGRLTSGNCEACGREGTVQNYCCKCGKEAS